MIPKCGLAFALRGPRHAAALKKKNALRGFGDHNKDQIMIAYAGPGTMSWDEQLLTSW